MRQSYLAFLLILSLLMMSFVLLNVQSVRAEPFTIHIRADGSIDPPTANITTYDNFTYTFTADNQGCIMIEKNDTVLDGARYTLRGFQNNTWSYYDPNDTVVAVDIPQRNNVTVQNINIINVPHGFYLYDDTNCTIRKNNINTSGTGWLTDTGVSIYGGGNCNLLVDNGFQGWIGVDVESSGNMILRNQFNSGIGVQLGESSWSINNTIAENNFWGNTALIVSSSIDLLYHNNFYSTTPMVDSWAQTNWNETYPTGGNYWADYTGTDLFSGPFQNESGSDGIGDTTFAVSTNETDNYPLMGPWIMSGESVIVKHWTGVSLKMAEVPEGGMTTFNAQAGPDPPHGFRVVGACYNISTTANLSGNIDVTIPYYSGNITQQEERVLRIMEWNETTLSWTNITASVDLQLHEITGQTNHLSLFAVIWRLGGDINGDFTVDIYDAILLAGCYNTTPKSASWNPNADLNNDNVVDIYDAIVLASNFNRKAP